MPVADEPICDGFFRAPIFNINTNALTNTNPAIKSDHTMAHLA
jgi:hypothetical protein